MHRCWRDRPYQRPSFSQIALILEKMKDEKSNQVGAYITRMGASTNIFREKFGFTRSFLPVNHLGLV